MGFPRLVNHVNYWESIWEWVWYSHYVAPRGKEKHKSFFIAALTEFLWMIGIANIMCDCVHWRCWSSILWTDSLEEWTFLSSLWILLSKDLTKACWIWLKMLYRIEPDGLVNLSFENFQKMVWLTMIHVLRFRIKHWKFLVHGYEWCVFFPYWLFPAEWGHLTESHISF